MGTRMGKGELRARCAAYMNSKDVGFSGIELLWEAMTSRIRDVSKDDAHLLRVTYSLVVLFGLLDIVTRPDDPYVTKYKESILVSGLTAAGISTFWEIEKPLLLKNGYIESSSRGYKVHGEALIRYISTVIYSLGDNLMQQIYDRVGTRDIIGLVSLPEFSHGEIE